MDILKFFVTLYDRVRSQKRGTIIVAQGCPSKILVMTGFKPKSVWIEMSSVCGIPVCHAELDSFDCRIVPNGFLIHVILHSKERKITWIAQK